MFAGFFAPIWFALIGMALVGLLTALGGLLGTPLALIRVWATERQTKATEEGLITDRINKAVEGLGTEKTVKADGEERTEPNIEVRIGALYALERISQDSERDHKRIMEILCAYIRENSAISTANSVPSPPFFSTSSDLPTVTKWVSDMVAFKGKELWPWCKRQKPRTDIQAALDVLGRRSSEKRIFEAQDSQHDTQSRFVFDFAPASIESTAKETAEWIKECDRYAGYRLDLRETNLQGADLSGLDFNGARLNGSKLNGACMEGTQLNGAQMWACEFQGATMKRAQFIGADLRTTKFLGSDLVGANLQASVMSFDKIQRPFLGNSHLNWAAIWKTDLRKFCEPQKISAAQLAYMFADSSLTLPEGTDRPKEWPPQDINSSENIYDIHSGLDFLGEWKRWMSDPAGYIPPQTR